MVDPVPCDLAAPVDLYGMKPCMTGVTAEWGRISVLYVRNGRVWFSASGGRGRAGIYWTTRSILFHETTWDP